MKLRVTHLTRYDYPQPVTFSPHWLYLHPRGAPLLRLRHFRLETKPAAKVIWTRDVQDNVLGLAYCWERADALSIQSEFEIETLEKNPFDFILEDSALRFPFTYPAAEHFALLSYLAPPFDDTQERLRAWLGQHRAGRPADTLAFLTGLNQLLYTTLDYVRRDEENIQSSQTTLELGSGSCRDFAVLFVESCRTLGLAARFVSGYLYDPDAGSPAHGSMHAWAEVYLPGAGWKGFDPTHGLVCDDAFIPCAHAAQADTISPVQGEFYSATPIVSRLQTRVSVEKLD